MSFTTLLSGLAELGDLVGVDILNPTAGDWMVLASDGSRVIVPDTVPKFEFRGDYRVSNYPVEQGAFASYNKVAEPFELRMTMVCGGLNFVQSAAASLGLTLGQQYMQKGDFLSTLDYMLSSTDLFTVVTPDMTYQSLTLDHYDYRREASGGATLLTVEAWFKQVRVTASASYSNPKSPSAASPINAGTVQAQPFTLATSFPLGTNPANIGPFQ
jgi:hypothetical protein